MVQSLIPHSGGQGGQMTARRAHPLERLQREFDTLFNRLSGGWLAPFEQDFGDMRVWDFDVSENPHEITVRAEMPGFEPNELEVHLTNNILTIKAEKTQKEGRAEEHRTYTRAVAMPAGIDANKVQATYRNGVLELHIPRAEGAQPRRINVQGDGGQQAQQVATQGTGPAAQTAKPQQTGNQSSQPAAEKARK